VNSFKAATLMRIFLDEADRFEGAPLFMAVVEELRQSGFAGATVLKGIEGYGCHERIHAARAIDYSTNLPVVIEVAEDEAKILELIPRLEAMIPEGLITLERIRMKPLTRGT
jgi:PII-like signaling protein